MEREFEMRSVGVDWICDECGKGTAHHIEGLNALPRYVHAFTTCGHRVELSRIYPYAKIVRVDK